MNPKERFIRCLKGQEVDRFPVINPTSVATIESASGLNINLCDVHLDPDKTAALASAGHDLLGFDSAAPYFSVILEAAALGCEIAWGTRTSMPSIKKHAFDDPDQFKMPLDFLDRKPIKTLLEAIRKIKCRYGNNIIIIGKAMGPWTLSYNLHGLQDFLIETVTEPEKVKGFVEKFKEITVAFAAAQIEAGADAIQLSDHVTADLISPATYVDFLLPVHKEIRNRIGDIPIILHVCGKTLDRIKHFSDTGFDLFHIDSNNDLKKARQELKGKMELTGAVNNLILFNGSREEVKEQTLKCLEAGIKFISPECAIPPGVKNENLVEIVNTVDKYCKNTN